MLDDNVCILCTQQHLVASQLRLFVRNQHHGNCQLAAFHRTTYPCCQPSTDGMGCNKRYHMAYTLQLDLPPNGKVFDSTMQVALSKALFNVYKPLVAGAAFGSGSRSGRGSGSCSSGSGFVRMDSQQKSTDCHITR